MQGGDMLWGVLAAPRLWQMWFEGDRPYSNTSGFELSTYSMVVAGAFCDHSSK